jgi:hypothetical protein
MYFLLRLATGLLFLIYASCSSGEPGGPPHKARASGLALEEPPEGGHLFARLRERPLRLQMLPPRTQCPYSGAIHLQGIPTEAALGPGVGLRRLEAGPIYVALPAIPRVLDLFPPEMGGWRSATVLVISRPTYKGPVLVRGRQLVGEGDIGFQQASQAERELRLPPGPWHERRGPLRVWDRIAHPRPGWRVAVAHLLMRTGGCYGLQLDGRSFSHEIRFDTIWQS